MFKEDDEQQDDSSIAVSRYPCMPSLVALQQMKNRLHLAYVGKKLMKWTAQATGRELRKISLDLARTYENFCEDVRDAFMLLARVRYFNPNLNKMVLEHIGHEANITVDAKVRAISGVKVQHFIIMDNGLPSYPHFGIEKGGQAVLEAKQAWRDLLKRFILIVELRDSFQLVDMANKNATKKMNVLAKIVIPRSLLSIDYILQTLEERAREEFFRFKRILQTNKKRREKKCVHGKPTVTCTECRRLKTQVDVEEKCIICGALLHPEEDTEEADKTKEEVKETEAKLQEFKDHIGEIVEITKEIEGEGIISVSVEDFLKTAEHLKEKLNEGDESQLLEPIPSDTALEQLCDCCRRRFEEEQTAKNITGEKTTPLRQESENIFELYAPKMETDLELGTFETEIQEITKIMRVRNEDGTVSEERKVIRIKREIRVPVEQKPLPLPASNNPSAPVSRNMFPSSEATNKSDSKKTIGVILVKDSKTTRTHKVKSEVLETSPAMADPKMRCCVSSMSFTTFVSSNFTLSFLSSVGSLSVDKIRELAASSTNFEEILKLFELHQNGEVATESIELNKNSRLTESDRELIARMSDSTARSHLRSKSGNNVKEEIKKKLKRTTSNSDKKNDGDENQSSEN